VDWPLTFRFSDLIITKLAHQPIKHNIYTKAHWPQNCAHLSCCVRYPGMCRLPHFITQYMCALYHGRCIQNDIKQLTNLSTFSFTFTIGFGLGILQSPPLMYALSLVHYVHIYNKIFKNPQKDVGILPYGSFLKLFDFSVQNSYWMHLENAFLLQLNHIPINNMISIRYIFLEE
jgi:hypothetical protein